MPKEVSFSIDLDNLWAYLKVKEDPKWADYPSYLPKFIPLFLDILDEVDIKITFFIVGKDASDPANRDLMQEIVKRGHEVANHSFNHEPWLHTYTEEKLKTEIISAEEAIEKVCSIKPIGFRGPGFVFNETLLKILKERNYLYDSSLLPSFIGPIARLYLSLISNRSENRDKLFGSFKDGLRTNKVHMLNDIVEIPVTTIPYLKTPFHLSYLMYLASYSPKLMNGYFQTSLLACKSDDVSPNFLIHPPDFLDSNQVPDLAFFPGMKIAHEKKREYFIDIVREFKKNFTPVLLSTRAKEKR